MKDPDDQPGASGPIRRREFGKILAGGVLGPALATTGATSVRDSRPRALKNTLHHVGADYHAVMGDPSLGWNELRRNWTSRANFEYHARHGVHHFTNIMSGDWDASLMQRWKDECDAAGMIWEAIRMDSAYIHLSPGTARDRKIDEIIANIQKASSVNVKVISMHWTMIPIRRNGHQAGRGGSSYHSFQLEENWKALPDESDGVVTGETYWERITHFLTTVIPVCREYDVRLAVHPYDPPGLPAAYQGVDNWDGAPASVFNSLKRYEAIVDSPYNGFQLCLGTIMEGLKDPGGELLPIVRYFAEKGKIYQVHMRNIRGGLHDFQEVYIDEGEANFIEVIRILRDSGYAWSICPDHVPTHPNDPGGYQGYAHAFGYIRALIDAANAGV